MQSVEARIYKVTDFSTIVCIFYLQNCNQHFGNHKGKNILPSNPSQKLRLSNWMLFSSDLKPSGMFVTVTDDPEFIIRKLVYSKEHTSQVYSFVEISEKLSSLK